MVEVRGEMVRNIVRITCDVLILIEPRRRPMELGTVTKGIGLCLRLCAVHTLSFDPTRCIQIDD